MHNILTFFTPGEWTSLGAIVVVLGALWRILRPLTKAVWQLIRTWEKMASGFPKLTDEVAAIKELLAQGAEWMSRHDEEQQDTKGRVVLLEETVGGLAERTSKLEGVISQ